MPCEAGEADEGEGCENVDGGFSLRGELWEVLASSLLSSVEDDGLCVELWEEVEEIWFGLWEELELELLLVLYDEAEKCE